MVWISWDSPIGEFFKKTKKKYRTAGHLVFFTPQLSAYRPYSHSGITMRYVADHTMVFLHFLLFDAKSP